MTLKNTKNEEETIYEKWKLDIITQDEFCYILK